MVEQVSRRVVVRDRLLLGLLYAGFFVVVFVLSAYWTFPYDRARSFVASQLSTKEAGGVTRTVEIGELEPVGLGGIRVGDLVITQMPATQDQEPLQLKLSEATAKLSLLPLLFGDKKLDLNAVAGTGTLDGKYDQSSDLQHIEAELNALDVSELGLGTWVGLPLKGKASGTVDLNVPADLTKATGSIKLEIRGLKVGDGKAKIKPPGMPGGLTLDEVDAGKLELAIEVRDGVAKLTRFSTDGKDLKLTGTGNVRLADQLKRSRPDINLELTFTEAFKNKSDRTKAMFELLALRPEWQRATTPEGTMHVHVGGTFLAIRGGPGR
jgi:type II secretion system protein N